MSEFKTVVSNKELNEKLYAFLEVIFHLYPEAAFHQLINTVAKEKNNDEEIYKTVQAGLPKIKPFLSELTLALPALKKQKKEMARQALKLLGSKTTINGYLEIGSTGRYISELRDHISLSGNIYLTNDSAPNNSVADIFERGQIKKIGQFFPLTYQPISPALIADESIDLISCNIGLHHCPLELLDAYIHSLKRILRKGGMFLMRDHDVKTSEMAAFVSLVHTVFNLGLNVSWETDHKEFKCFKSINEWSKLICSYGFTETGGRVLQDRDPSDNTLIAFVKQ